MNWKTVMLPRPLRSAYKRLVKLRDRLRCRWASFRLRRGRPQVLASFLAGRGLRGRIVLQKQGIRSIVAGDRFLRFADGERGATKLRRELAGWRELRAAGFESILVPELAMHELDGAVLLETELLEPVAMDEQIEKTRPIVELLVARARPGPPGRLPETIVTALGLAREVCDAELLARLEAALHEAFARPLLTGHSHQDLHLRNVMKERDGRPILIDLKSTARDQVVALDLLVFACKYWLARDLHNVIAQARRWHRDDWRIPGLDPLLALVDLPRPVWALVFVLHVFGRALAKGDAKPATRRLLGPRLRKLVGELAP